MPQTLVCPEETDLLAFAAGEDFSSHLVAHVASCPYCQPAVLRLKAEIGRLRSTQTQSRRLSGTKPATPQAGRGPT
jgi:hypothetical protein